MSDGDPKTGRFHQRQVTMGDAAYSVNGVLGQAFSIRSFWYILVFCITTGVTLALKRGLVSGYNTLKNETSHTSTLLPPSTVQFVELNTTHERTWQVFQKSCPRHKSHSILNACYTITNPTESL